MNANFESSEPLRAYRRAWGRIRELRWCAGLDFSFLRSERTLFTARDILGAEPNQGAAAHLGICLKSLRFHGRLVRRLIDVRTGRIQPQCTLWFTRPYPLGACVTDCDWRIAYHKQLLKFERARIGLTTLDALTRSLERDQYEIERAAQRRDEIRR